MVFLLVLATIILCLLVHLLTKQFIIRNKIFDAKIDKNDYEIAKILFEYYFDENFDEHNIAHASYNEDSKKFECKYIIDIHSPLYYDSVVFSTSDFNNYTLNSTFYTKEGKSWIPHNSTIADYLVKNTTKNEIIKLAKERNYKIGNIMSIDDYKDLLNLVLQEDKKELSQLFEKGNYILDSYSFTSYVFTFNFLDIGNSQNYIELKSTYDNLAKWKVFGSSNRPFKDSQKDKDRYYLNYSFEIPKKKMAKIEEYYNILVENND